MLRTTFWTIYDHLGACLVLNLLWFVCSIPWFGAIWGAFVLLVPWLGAVGLITGVVAGLGSLWLNPASLTVTFAAGEWVRFRSPDAAVLRAVFVDNLLRGCLWSIAFFALTAILGINAAFYLRVGWLPQLLGFLLAGVMVWAQAILLLLVFHSGVRFTGNRALPVRLTLREAALLILRAPLPAVGLGIGTMVIGALLALTQIGVPFLSMSVAATFAATGQVQIRRRLYPQNENEQDPVPETRTLRDLIKPWEMDR